MTKRKLREMYLDWVNNFLTASRFAEYYGLLFLDACRAIDIGRKLHERHVSKLKEVSK